MSVISTSGGDLVQLLLTDQGCFKADHKRESSQHHINNGNEYSVGEVDDSSNGLWHKAGHSEHHRTVTPKHPSEPIQTSNVIQSRVLTQVDVVMSVAAIKPSDDDYKLSSKEFYHTEKDWILFAQEIDEKAIRASKGEQSMPCMAETVGIITTQLDKYLAADWLDDSEKEAICFYKQQVLSLKNNGYPYKESLVLALEFTLIQDLYNFLSIDHVPENEAEEIKASSIADLDFDWGKHTELYNKAPGRFYSEVDFGPLTLENLIHQDWNTAFFGISSEQQEKFNNVTTSAIERETDDVKKVQMKQILAEKKKNEFKQRKTILTMQMMLPAIIGTDFEGVMEVLPTASDKKLFVPVFCDMTIKTMNLAQNTALVPIGLTTERVALHDQLKMSSAVLAFHDVFHESKIKSGVVDENIKRKKSHNMIVSFYKNQRQVNEYIHFIAENMLFGLGHEEGEELSDYVKNADILKEKLSMIKMFMEILPSSLLPPSFSLNDGEYSNKELEGLRWLQAHIESVFAPSSSDSSALAIFCRLQREAQVSV